MSIEALIDLLDSLIKAVVDRSNVRAYHKPLASARPCRWELHRLSPQQYIGNIELSALQIVKCRTMKKDVLANFAMRKVEQALARHASVAR